jgi:hypothetical protein
MAGGISLLCPHVLPHRMVVPLLPAHLRAGTDHTMHEGPQFGEYHGLKSTA